MLGPSDEMGGGGIYRLGEVLWVLQEQKFIAGVFFQEDFLCVFMLMEFFSYNRVPRASWTCPNCKRVGLQLCALSGYCM